MRQRKPETIIRELTRDLRKCREQLSAMSGQRSRLLDQVKALERALLEWQARFDALLRWPKP